MYLSRLEMFGFKSFAKRVRIDFNKGVSAIIGPNGCGKTNVIDAIRWVIGERKIKLLRGETLESVIFKGSATKNALNMAEVTITFSECRGLLSFDPAANQLSITRRTFRDGNSEFFMNGQPVRLKDVRNILLELSISSGVYSIIEQKMMQEIIEDNQESRRTLFEEAADILKFKTDRKATEKKLEIAMEEMKRVEDVYSEVGKQVETLKKQATKARTYNQLKSKISQANQQIQISRLSKLRKDNELAEESIKKCEVEEAELRTKRVKLNEKETLLRGELANIVSERENKAQSLNTIITDIGQINRDIAVLEEKQKRAILDIENYKTAAIECKEKIAQLQIDEETAEEEADRIKKEIPLIDQQIEQLQTQADDIIKDLVSLKNQLGQKRKAKEDTERQKWQQIQKRQQLSENIEKNSESLQKGETERESLAKGLDEKSQQLENSNNQLKQTSLDYDRLEKELEELNAENTSSNEELQKNLTTQNSLREKISQIRGELKGFESTGDMARDALLKKKDEFSILGILADFIIPDSKKSAEEMELFFGERTGFLVCKGSKDACDALSYLRENKLGTAGFFVLDELSTLSSPKGFSPIADKVKCKLPELEILLCDAFDPQVLGSPNSTIDTNRQIIFRSGYYYGGYTEKGLVTKSLKIRELNKDLDRNQQVLESKVDEANRLREKIESITIKREKCAIELKVTEKKLHNDRIEQANKEIEVETTRKEITKLDSSISALREAIDDDSKKIDSFEVDEKDFTALDEEIGNLESQIEDKTLELREKEKKQQEKVVQKVKLTGDKNQKEADLSRFAGSIAEQFQIFEKANKDQLEATEVKDEAGIKVSELKVNIENLHAKRKKTEDKLNEATAKEQDVNSTIEDLIKQDREVSRLLGGVEERLHEHRTLKTRNDSDIENIYENFPDLKEMDIADGEILSDDDIQSRIEEVAKLKNSMEKLFPVNFEAEAEYEEAKKRHDFFKTQRDDINESVKILNRSIKQLNAKARKVFTETFEQARANFKEVFKELFGGGDADIILVDKDGETENVDVLEADINIIARPPRKKQLLIAEMSQGEKALVAISLLFGLYLVRPSPFCMLDEVDAPLDESNVKRYLNIIKRFDKQTQFILITHNKMTMQSVDYLYGITMEEGVTDVLSVGMDELDRTQEVNS